LGFGRSIAGEEEEEEVGEGVFLFCLLVTCSDGGEETEEREGRKGGCGGERGWVAPNVWAKV
jgi:hypothetical protein